MEEKIFFKTVDKLELCGILSRPKKSTQKCIILCHGLTVDKEEDGIFTELSRRLVKLGFNVFRFDFRGHGESEGDSTEMTIAGEERDLEAAIEFLRRKEYSDFGVLGASFAGGAVSFFMVKNQALIKTLVLWNALIDYSAKLRPKTEWGRKYWGKPAFERVKKFGFTEIGSRKFKVGKKLMEEMKSLEPWKELLKLEIPVLFIHGDKDTYIPYNDSLKYSKMMRNAGLMTVKGAEHGFHDDKKHSDLVLEATVEFFLKYL